MTEINTLTKKLTLEEGRAAYHARQTPEQKKAKAKMMAEKRWGKERLIKSKQC